ncbi:ribosomal-processing cysteine protease Prp [[Eubacterium] hominis]|uniref:ribosomal-processing cysteine protease Prp n=1 Tax=[Eubacterium] hominis TaxID=2764325 RepID=UPI003A4E401D
MVKVTVLHQHQKIVHMTICGHAGYADKGQDLVCAGVSSIAIGMMNALDQMEPDTCDLSMKDADVEIQVNKVTEGNQLLLRGMIIQLQTLKETYKKYVQINEQEV